MISDRQILIVSNTEWDYPGELQVIGELLSGGNNLIWISPFGKINATLLPRIVRIKETLTIYNPGINYLPLSFLDGFNRSRLLLHTRLYLLERDFEPNLVIIDHPNLLKFAAFYQKSRASSLYYLSAASFLETPREDRAPAENTVDHVYRAKALPAELSEDQYLELIEAQVDDISKMVKLGQKVG